jgi:hypothetical protein
MALDWFEKVQKLLVRTPGAATGLAEPVTARRDSRAGSESPPPPSPPPPTWWDTYLDLVPLVMAIVGSLLTIFTEKIGAWALLGYLLLTVAPVVFWLRRIEKRLAELIRRTNSTK